MVDGFEINNQTQERSQIMQGAAEAQPTTQNLNIGGEEENEDVVMDNVEDAGPEVLADSRHGEKQKAKVTKNDTGSVPRSTVDILDEEGYDWNEDYFGFKNSSVKEANGAKIMFTQKWEKHFSAYTINDSNWDTHIVNFGKVCDKAVKINKPRGVVGVLKPIILSRVSGDRATALKLDSLNVEEIVKIFKDEVSENNHPQMIVKDFVKVMSADEKSLSTQEFNTLSKFVKFIKARSTSNVIGLLGNVATKEEYKISFDFFKDSSFDFQSFLQEYRNKASNVNAVKNKIGGNSVFVGRVSKKPGNSKFSKQGLDGSPRFYETVKFFREKFGGKRLNEDLFKRLKNRHSKNLCVACGENRNHNWKSCANSDLRQ